MKPLVFFLLTTIVLAIGARDWPDDYEHIATFFGRSISGRFSRGLEFQSNNQRVKTWNDGEIIWSSDSMAIESIPGDSHIVVEHEGDFRTSYSGVDFRPDLEKKVFRGDWLGYAGENSWLFQITDSIHSRIVDPLSLLPVRPIKTSHPHFRVYLVQGRSSVELVDGLILQPGVWSIALEGVMPSGLFVYWVGQGIRSLSFESLVESGDSVVMEAPEPIQYDEIYDDSGRLVLKDLNFSSGRGILELIVLEGSDQTVSKKWTITVRGESQ